MSLSYRPDIDGLRAVAIGSVLIYHLKLAWGESVFLQGGFLGVDVFFVISGYLITAIILSDIEKPGGFSYADFYDRRARRLLPPLLVVLIATAAFGYFVLLPSAMIEMVSSAVASIFFVSNIYWQGVSQEYGAASGQYQPLLHTWSLAVEEQFYLIYPTVLLFALRKFTSRMILLACCGIVCGLGIAVLLTKLNFSFSFYWPISRVWELLAGSLAALLVARGLPVTGPWGRVLPNIGLLFIFVSVLSLSLSQYHPGVGTVPAVLGTVLILLYGNAQSFASRMLSFKPLVWIGLISYSLYLWHYPIYAFGRIMRPELLWFDYAIWIVLSFGLAWASWRFVERPFRDRSKMPLRQVVYTLGGACALICGFAITMLVTDGMRTRLPHLITLYGENEFDNETLKSQSWGTLASLAAGQGMGPSYPREPSDFEKNVLWFDPDGDGHRVLIVGDSNSKDMFNVLNATSEAQGGNFQTARYALPMLRAADYIEGLLEAPNFQVADLVIITYRYRANMLPHLGLLIEAIEQEGKPVVLMSSSREFAQPAGETIFDIKLRKAGKLESAAIDAAAWEMRLTRTDEVNPHVAATAARYDLPFFEKDEYLCDPVAERCAMVTPEGRKVFYDYGHYTLEGAEYFGRRIAELGWFSEQALSRLTQKDD